jgi:hypothetical protein
MPKQTQTLGAMGQPTMQTLPYMMRPLVSQDEPMCSGYSPTPEAMKEITKEQEEQKKEQCCDEPCDNSEGCCKDK